MPVADIEPDVVFHGHIIGVGVHIGIRVGVLVVIGVRIVIVIVIGVEQFIAALAPAMCHMAAEPALAA